MCDGCKMLKQKRRAIYQSVNILNIQSLNPQQPLLQVRLLWKYVHSLSLLAGYPCKYELSDVKTQNKLYFKSISTDMGMLWVICFTEFKTMAVEMFNSAVSQCLCKGRVNYDVVFRSFKIQRPGCEEQLITDLLRLEYQVRGTVELVSQSIQQG